ncbi:helix-turn-helix domain-containing protein [Nocardia cyriacigeorgica]|uniref:helix-turn-helix domain-containing protein n=1 Tax=Nocardia cyriacigeorgica TaxID=135487 RepID=UPI002458BF78|nr:helix-turn-helix domain-containing protein [Nocardia cyriacigeorgica]
MLSVAAAADCCGVSTRTMRRWIAEGRLQAKRVGPRLVRIDPDELAKLLEPIGGDAA